MDHPSVEFEIPGGGASNPSGSFRGFRHVRLVSLKPVHSAFSLSGSPLGDHWLGQPRARGQLDAMDTYPDGSPDPIHHLTVCPSHLNNRPRAMAP